ncbi:MAG: hypothetical protein ABIF87_17175 [Pseudomonadota bacterium]
MAKKRLSTSGTTASVKDLMKNPLCKEKLIIRNSDIEQKNKGKRIEKTSLIQYDKFDKKQKIL